MTTVECLRCTRVDTSDICRCSRGCTDPTVSCAAWQGEDLERQAGNTSHAVSPWVRSALRSALPVTDLTGHRAPVL